MTYEEIYSNNYNRLVSIALSWLKNRSDAEDAVGDVFLSILNKKRDFTEFTPDEIAMYLTTSVKNRCYNIFKHRKIENVYKDSLIIMRRYDDAVFKKACSDEAKEYIADRVEKLSHTYRKELKFYVIDEMSVSEIAEISNESKETVKKRVARGKKKLGEYIKEDYRDYF